jgi:LPPG:FO 2-phospho-L-lactate transferase
VIIGNTGDDTEFYGLHISPDLDIVMYTLAGVVDESKGWGVRNDSFNCLDMLEKLGLETWFKLGDRDLAVHIVRTQLLKRTLTLAQATNVLCKMLGIEAKLVPMTNDPVRTKIMSDQLKLDFQEYFVKRGTKDKVTEVFFEGAEKAKSTIAAIKAIKEAERIIVCPSNPILSISPILAIPKIRTELRSTSAHIVGVSPIVGGKALKGPADKIMTSLGLESTSFGVAKCYKDFLDHWIIDKIDAYQKERIEKLGVKVTVAETVMTTLEDAIRLARILVRTE